MKSSVGCSTEGVRKKRLGSMQVRNRNFLLVRDSLNSSKPGSRGGKVFGMDIIN